MDDLGCIFIHCWFNCKDIIHHRTGGGRTPRKLMLFWKAASSTPHIDLERTGEDALTMRAVARAARTTTPALQRCCKAPLTLLAAAPQSFPPFALRASLMLAGARSISSRPNDYRLISKTGHRLRPQRAHAVVQFIKRSSPGNLAALRPSRALSSFSRRTSHGTATLLHSRAFTKNLP
jgi:hypothetical protein